MSQDDLDRVLRVAATDHTLDVIESALTDREGLLYEAAHGGGSATVADVEDVLAVLGIVRGWRSDEDAGTELQVSVAGYDCPNCGSLALITMPSRMVAFHLAPAYADRMAVGCQMSGCTVDPASPRIRPLTATESAAFGLDAPQAAEPDRRGITLTRDQVEAWVGRTLTDEQVERIEDCMSTSSIPDAISTIAWDAVNVGDDDEPELRLSAGDRVRFRRAVDRFPHAAIQAGETGTVVTAEPMLVAIRPDLPREHLAEWNGCLEWYPHEDESPDTCLAALAEDVEPI